MQNYIIGNWKSNKTIKSTQAWLDDLNDALPGSVPKDVVVAVAPPFISLQAFVEQKGKHPRLTNLQTATQDVSTFAAGSYTGAVSVENLEGLGVAYAIVGHSERRRYFHEKHQDVANKVAQCVDAGITPIVCVDDEYIAEQASAIDSAHLEKCLVAYEELGAIGTGENESPEHVAKVVQHIKKVFADVPVLYGGSVKPGNVDQYIDVCDGVLVGGASLDAAKFAQIVSAW